MHPDPDHALRDHLVRLLTRQDAHAGFDRAVEGLPAAARGSRPAGLPYAPWELVEHLRLAQRDILDFCRRPDYVEPVWPDDYWPETAAPPTPEAWNESVAAFQADRDAFVALVLDPTVDLYARIPHGTGQTYLREALVLADHNAYHVGELVAVRRLLGAWPPEG